MSTQDSWNWKVPTAEGTRWDDRSAFLKQSILHEWPKDLPFVNVYCEGTEKNPHGLWLIGSFQVSAEVWNETNEIFWHISNSYITGDGYTVELRNKAVKQAQKAEYGGARKEGDPVVTRLVDDTVLETALDRVNADQSKVRATYNLRCDKCDLSKSLRSDNPKIPTFASTLYTIGYREVSLSSVLDHFR